MEQPQRSRVAGVVIVGVPVARLRSGVTRRLGTFTIEVVGPGRRFQSANDGSLVLWVRTAHRTLLLAGDIEAVAQRELPAVLPDVMLVPHHGSATSDLDWLARTAGQLAVISVGENTYGHPSPAVLEALRVAGVQVQLTRDVGDVVVPLN